MTSDLRWVIALAEKYGQELRRVAPYLANHRFPGYTYSRPDRSRDVTNSIDPFGNVVSGVPDFDGEPR